MQDRRSHSRFPVEGFVSLSVVGAEVRNVKARLANVCFKGMAVIAEEPIGRGSIVSVHLVNVPIFKVRTVLGKAEVVSTGVSRTGGAESFKVSMRFTDVNRDLIQRLIQEVQRLRAQQVRGQTRAGKAAGSGSFSSI